MNLINQLTQYVESQPDFKKADPAFVSVYRHYRCYGGPEEGGWWYDAFQFQGAKPFHSRDEAEAWLETAKAEIERNNRDELPARCRAMSNLPDPDLEPLPDYPDGEGYIPQDWNDGGELLVTVEEQAGELDTSNQPRPHYE